MEFVIKNPSTVAVLFEPHTEPFTFELRKEGALYFFRVIKEGVTRIKVNIKHPGSYVGNFGAVQEIGPMKIKPLHIHLPPPIRKGEMKNKIQIVFNPDLTKDKGSPARNYYKEGRIEIGPFFKEQIPAIRYFILLHEYAHFFYKNETACDLYAANEFIKDGYNNSTALYALTRVLRDTKPNAERILSLYKNLSR